MKGNLMAELADDPRVAELLILLWDAPDRDAGIAIVELPHRLRTEELLTACEGAQLIQFARRNHCWHGGGPFRKLVLEPGWSIAELHEPGRKQARQALQEAIAEVVPDEIRIRVQLGYRGSAAAGQLALARRAVVDASAAGNPLGINTTPATPKPPIQFVEAAGRDIPSIMANVPPRHDEAIELVASHLAKRLQDAGHTLAAAQWGVHESVLAGRLQPGLVKVGLPHGIGLDGRVHAPFGLEGTVGLPKDKPAPFVNFKVTATEALWEWWRSVPAELPGPAQPAGPAIANTEEQTEVEDSEPAAAPVDMTPNRRGRKKASYATEQKESALAAKWKKAHEAGTYKAHFAKDNGLTKRDLEKLLGRVRKRQHRKSRAD